jgi:hypothetical protein
LRVSQRHYAEKIIPAVEKLKFNYFGHDSVVLHEHEIRKQKGDFAFLSHKPTRDESIERLSSIMEASNFILMACVVDKARLNRNDGAGSNPYHIALGICMEVLREFLAEKMQDHLQTHVVVECRGKKEDAELELADLVARPVGLNHIRPEQANLAFELLKKKFFCDGGRQRVGQGYQNTGLKIYPPQKTKSPGEPTEAVAPTRNPQST